MEAELTEESIASLTAIFGSPEIKEHPELGSVSASVKGFISSGSNNTYLSRGGQTAAKAISNLWKEVAQYVEMARQSPDVCVYHTSNKEQPEHVIGSAEEGFSTCPVQGNEAKTVFGLDIPVGG